MGQVIYQSHATSTLLDADKRRIKEEYVYLDITTQRQRMPRKVDSSRNNF